MKPTINPAKTSKHKTIIRIINPIFEELSPEPIVKVVKCLGIHLMNFSPFNS